MTNEEFNALVKRLEGEARRDASGYGFRVWLLAMLGNAYLASMLLLLAALFLGALVSVMWVKALAIKLIIPIGAFLWLVARALWVSVPPPDGTEVRRADAPALFAMLDELRGRLTVPPLHHVLIDDRFNAGVVQSPRLGMFGWYRNYLLIGLPLMKSLTVEQFKAVLAHELGHLSRGHGRISNWIYRQRIRWARLMAVLEEKQSRGSFLFKPFLERYAPYFNAYSFPLARANEYEADAAASRLASPAAAAQALTGVNVFGRFLSDRFWPGLYQRADDSPQPAFAPYASMAFGAAEGLDADSAQRWLEQALAETTGLDDTHPSLADRLGAMGEPARLAPPGPGEGADQLLGSALQRVTDDFDARWHASVLSAWEARHREVQEGRRHLADLDSQASAGDLSLDHAYERARLTESFGPGPDAALEQFRALQERAPEDPIACYALGARLLARDDGAGLALVERAMQLDDQLVGPGGEAMRDYCWRKGLAQDAHGWHQRMVEGAERRHAAEREWNELSPSDQLEKHGISDEVIASLRSQLQAIPGLRKAYFVRKQIKHSPERPCYVLGFIVRRGWRRSRRAVQVQRQIAETVKFPGETLILSVEGANSGIGRDLQWMDGARIL